MLRKVLPVFLFVLFALIILIGEAEAKNYQMVNVGNGRKLKVEFFDIVNLNKLQCKPVFIRAKIMKIDRQKKVTFLKIVSKTYKGLFLALNFVVKWKKGKHVVGMVCIRKKQFAFFSRRTQ